MSSFLDSLLAGADLPDAMWKDGSTDRSSSETSVNRNEDNTVIGMTNIDHPRLPTISNEIKPRLGRDEVDILEEEFKQNPKPPTQTKRQYAEEMGVDLARINVGRWFSFRKRVMGADYFTRIGSKTDEQKKSS